LPKEQDASFVYQMEDVLEVYTRPFDPKRPQICMDEMGKTVVSNKYPEQALEPGQAAREDYTYKNLGRYNLFIAYDPLAGKRVVKVTNQRTKKDWAHFMQEVAQKHYPQAEKIVLVMDNLNTHTLASFYEVFPPAKAKALAERFEVHYTPKHASWLNIAEIELSVLARQAVNARVSSLEQFFERVASWQQRRNAQAGTVNWRFTTADARIKLKRLYPVQQPAPRGTAGQAPVTL
jgi:hypothetical protein